MKINFAVLFIIALSIGSINKLFSQSKPNIILIFVDDLGYGDLGCYGQDSIQTPNIDFLAESGMRFTHFYSGSTVCAPSRESMLTGMTTGHTFIRGNFLTDENEDPAIPLDKTTIPAIMKEAGYRTGLYGKWGLGGESRGPENFGFDSSFCYLDQIQAHNYYPPYLYDNGERVYIDENQNDERGVYSHDLFIDKTLRFIDDAQEDEPFFLYLPYTIPHGSFTLPVEEPYLDKDWDNIYKVYATMISKLDRDVGKITSLVEEKGLADNTIILFTSDNGANHNFARFFGSNGPFRGGKRDLYEGGIRIPLIAYWPGKIKAGTVSDHISAAYDFMPTFNDLAGVRTPGKIDGLSFAPTLLGKEQKEHEYLYWENYTYNYVWYKPNNYTPRNYLNNQAVRFDNWKAVLRQEEGQTELYDLYNDMGEQENVADEYPEVVEKANDFLAKATVDDAEFFPYTPDSLAKLHIFDFASNSDMKDFFRYTPDRIPIVSSHRGAPALGYPENSIATFTHTLRHTWSIMEIDPHYTKDSAIVLMHDPTLNRTSTGKGKVSDYTLEELRDLNLKDVHGNVTKFKIPTLCETLEWAKNKTIIIIDMKDVSAEKRAEEIIEHGAQNYAMVMCYSFDDAKKVYEIDERIMMEVFIPDVESAERFEKTGVPWSNVVAFVTHGEPKDPNVFDYLHEREVMAIRGSSFNIDRKYSSGKISRKELQKGYQNFLTSGTDIIEADLGVHAGKEVYKNSYEGHDKMKYFKYEKVEPYNK